ncbi:MAG: hypothetical protein NWF00_02680 [Candidatus Bathyarchaeota archaeon]|nr:hypothetical protein [Candidatus Bathyarchaeota archaeon]
MIKNTTINSNALAKEAKVSKNKETYKLIEKNQIYRIGVGARADSTDAPSFFIEVLVSLSAGSGEVDLSYLKKALTCLKTLQSKGYLLAFEDGNIVSCEKKRLHDLNEEYLAVKSLLKTAFV